MPRVCAGGSTGAAGANGRVGQHPGVLAAAAALPRDDVTLLAGDSRQPSRHQAVVAAAVGDQEDAKHQRPAFEVRVVPDRRVRQRQELLDDVGVRGGAEPLRPFPAGVRIEVGEEHRLHRRVGERRLDHAFCEPAPGIGERRGFTAPPGGNGRRLQRLAEEPLADRREEREQRRRLDDAHAERVDDHHVPRAPRLHEAGHSQLRVRPELERIAIVVVEPAKNGVNRPEAGDRLQVDATVAHGQVAPLDQRRTRAGGRDRRARSRSRRTAPG